MLKTVFSTFKKAAAFRAYRLGIKIPGAIKITLAGLLFVAALFVLGRHPSYYNCWGVYFYQHGNLKLANKYFNKALQLQPGFTNAYCNRGIVREERGELQRAVEDYNTALWLDPRHATARYNRARIFCQTGELSKALCEFKALLRLEPLNERYKYFVFLIEKKSPLSKG